MLWPRKKSDKARMCGIVAECLSHINQDALCFEEFTDENGEKVYVGAISDGCSGALGSEHGSKFMVQTFVEEVGKLIGKSKRDGDFMRLVALNLIERMADYRPQRNDTGIKNFNGINVSEELAATLYAFVADNKSILIMLAGDGSIAINDHRCGIDQEKGDIYPKYILSFPRKTWEKRLDDIFVFSEFPAEKISSVMLATDGFTHPSESEYSGLVDDPAMFILHAEHLATLEEDGMDIPGASAFRGGDDASALVFANPGASPNGLISRDEVAKLGAKVEYHFSGKFFREISNAQSVTVRESARKCDPTNDPAFARNISHAKGVCVFGITASDRTRYKKQQQQIIASRIVCEDALAALFGAPSKPKPARSSLKTDLPSRKKLLNDVIVVRKSDVPQVKIAPTITVTPKVNRQPKKMNERASKWRRFSDLCSITGSRRTGIGFRQFGQVMYDLWHFVNNCHLQSMRIGNLRPWDILYRINPAHTDNDGVKKSTTYAFSLANPENSAKVEKGGKLIQNYSNLDVNFIHPEYFPKLSTDDQARLDQDWYAYSVLCYWFVTKFDPFGEGVVKAKSDADRIYRMEKVLTVLSSKIEAEKKKKDFVRIAMQRIGFEIETILIDCIARDKQFQNPNLFLHAFNADKIQICDNRRPSPFKKDVSIKCNFKQLEGHGICPLCENPIRKEIVYAHV